MNLLTKSKNYKCILGASFAFLVCAGSFAPTCVYAVDVPQTLTDWVDGISAKSDALLQEYVNASGDPNLQASYYGAVVACSAWEAYAKYCVNAVEILPENSEITRVSASDLWFGWYYLPGDTGHSSPKNCTIFGYGYNGDPTKIVAWDHIVLASGSDFTINLNANVPDYATLYCSSSINGRNVIRYGFNYEYNNYMYYNQYWSGVSASGIFANSSFSQLDRAYTVLAPSDNVVTLSNSSVGYYVRISTSSTDPLPLCGQLYGAPTTYTNHLVFPGCDATEEDIVDTIHDQLFTDFPVIMPEIWEDLEFPTEPYTGEIDNVNLPPGYPSADFHDIEVPTDELPSGLTDGATFWFSAFSTLVDSLNLKPYVILFLCIMLVLVILKI